MAGKTLSTEKALRQAKSLARKGDTDGARQIYRDILARFPKNRRALDGMASLETTDTGTDLNPVHRKAASALSKFQTGDHKGALIEADALARQFPNAVALQNLLGAINGKLERHQTAAAHYRKAIALDPGNADAHAGLGASLTRLGKDVEALPVLEKAAALLAEPSAALNNLGNALRNLGRFDEADAAYQRAIDARPDFAVAHRNMSMIRTYRAGDRHMTQMEALLAKELDAESRSQLCFALAKACEDTGEEERAFDLTVEGNRLKRSMTEYDLRSDRVLFDRLQKVFADPPTPPAAAVPGRKRPIFIVGMPRSGSSLVEQVLASHSQVHGAGELDFATSAVKPVIEKSAGRPDANALEAVRRSYLADLRSLNRDEPVIADKMPLNFRWIGFILTALPEAAVIHTRRNPIATGWSIYKQYFPASGLRFSWDLSDIAGYMELYAELMAFWHEKFPGRIHDLEYEALTENQEAETRALLDHCGLAWEASCLDFHLTDRPVLTASAMQVRQPIYQGSSEAWRKYEEQLAPLTEMAEKLSA